MEEVLKVEKLTKFYGKSQALFGLDFSVKKGEIFALIGPNGAGKSTALKIIATLLQPSGGTVKIGGLSLLEEAEKIRKVITYLPEDSGAYKNLSGLDYLRLMADIYADNKKEAERMVDRAREISGLGIRLRDKSKTYSKGMVRKLLLARTMMATPMLSILDEPTSGLDVVNATEIRQTIKAMASEGMAVLLSSHNMLEIEFLSDSVAIIDRGQIHEIGSPADLKRKYKAANLEEVFMKVAGSHKELR